MDSMQQFACLIVNAITVYSYHGFLFNYTAMGQASDSMTDLIRWLVSDACLWQGPLWRGSTWFS